MDRLFVPLSRNPFEDFQKRGKEYEIRAYGRNFTEKTVFEGRCVELRLGYSVRQEPEENWRLWGRIGKVLQESLEDIFSAVEDVHHIEPSSNNAQEAITENLELLGDREKYIGFQVILER